jgi:DNA-binding GntR family transcriptional regulator
VTTEQPGTAGARRPSSFRLIPVPPAAPTSVGDAVYDQILEALQQGRLRPGERLHDGDFAAQLGVSRTPVREALLRLRELGVVEFAPARYTRVAIIDETQTIHAIAAWVTVYATIAALVAGSGLPATALDEMADAHARFHVASEPYDIRSLAAANADFYDQPPKYCDNPILVRFARSAVHVVRLGLLQIPEPLNPAPLHAAQAALLAALTAADPRAARQAVYRIAAIPLSRNPS